MKSFIKTSKELTLLAITVHSLHKPKKKKWYARSRKKELPSFLLHCPDLQQALIAGPRSKLWTPYHTGHQLQQDLPAMEASIVSKAKFIACNSQIKQVLLCKSSNRMYEANKLMFSSLYYFLFTFNSKGSKGKSAKTDIIMCKDKKN